jgi:hypothetical protein
MRCEQADRKPDKEPAQQDDPAVPAGSGLSYRPKSFSCVRRA